MVNETVSNFTTVNWESWNSTFSQYDMAWWNAWDANALIVFEILIIGLILILLYFGTREKKSWSGTGI